MSTRPARGWTLASLAPLRLKAGLSQHALAEKSDLAWQTVWEIETGRRRAYDKTLWKLAGALAVQPWDLIKETV